MIRQQFNLTFIVEDNAIHMRFGNLALASSRVDENFESFCQIGIAAFIALWRLGSTVLLGHRKFDNLAVGKQRVLALIWQVFRFEPFEAHPGARHD